MPTRAELDHTRARQRLEILDRLAAGETLKAACARPGMPRPESVVRWGVRDRDFRAAMDVAARRGAYERDLRYDWDRAEAVLGRLRAGATMRQVERDPAMPGRRVLRYWMSIQPAFGEEVERLRRLRASARGARLGAARRGLAAWDAGVADRVLFHVGQGVALGDLRTVDACLPSAWAVRRWRRDRPAFDYELGVNLKMGRLARARARRRARMAEVCGAIVEGASLGELAGRDGFPHRTTLYGWVRRDPAIARDVARACEHRTHWYTDQMQMIAERVGPGDPAGARRAIRRLEGRLGRLWQRPGRRWLG